MSATNTHRSGEILAGRYRVIALLGAGGFGVAYRAWDLQTGVPVVLKQPLAEHTGNPDVLARFDREINRLCELEHPHIVPILDHGHDSSGRPYLAMRFLPAGSLADRGKPQPLPHLHRWLPAVAAALDFVHARGIVHRDIKPANIFFDTHTVAYLGDFGIAKIIDDELAEASEHSLTSTGGEIGTYPYMAPEFFRKPRILSGAYDQYALAVTVYEMVCGRRPFSGDSGQLIFAHATQEPPDIRQFCADAPESLRDAVSRSLAKKSSERFPTCSAFVDRALQEVPVVAVNRSVQHFLCPSCRRLVRVPANQGGRSGRCSACGANLRISGNLDALWLTDEAPASAAPPPSRPKTIAEDSRNTEPLRPTYRHYAVLSFLALAIVVLGTHWLIVQCSANARTAKQDFLTYLFCVDVPVIVFARYICKAMYSTWVASQKTFGDWLGVWLFGRRLSALPWYASAGLTLMLGVVASLAWKYPRHVDMNGGNADVVLSLSLVFCGLTLPLSCYLIAKRILRARP